MSETVWVSLISGLAALGGAFLGLVGALWAADRTKKLELQSESETVHAALRAEIIHARETAKKQLDHVAGKGDTLKAGALEDPLDWMPIRVAVWDQLKHKVGVLPTGRMVQVVDFFAYVSWVNEMVGMREKIPRDKLDQFGAKYITALRTIEDKGAAAS